MADKMFSKFKLKETTEKKDGEGVAPSAVSIYSIFLFVLIFETVSVKVLQTWLHFQRPAKAATE